MAPEPLFDERFGCRIAGGGRLQSEWGAPLAVGTSDRRWAWEIRGDGPTIDAADGATDTLVVDSGSVVAVGAPVGSARV